MNRRNLIAGAGASVIAATPAKSDAVSPFQDALERIALLDEADGHELTWEHASRAVGIACQALGNKHPSQIVADRYERRAANPSQGNEQ